MIVEHSFVTTLDIDESLGRASRFLEARGFRSPEPAEGGDGRRGTRVVLRRGRQSPARARSLIECPQSVSLEWDRGRVTVVASIVPRPRLLSLSSSSAFSDIVSEDGPRHRDPRRLLFALARALEALLAGQQEAAEAGREWFELETEIDARDRRRRRDFRIILTVFLCILGGLIVLAIYSTRSKRRR